MIYAEWTLYGVFHNAWFHTWQEYFAATFCPDCEIIRVKKF